MTGLKTLFVISLLTSRMIIPTTPSLYVATPPSPATKAMTMELTSTSAVDGESWARCAIPEGLGFGAKVDLKINVPFKPTVSGTAPVAKPQVHVPLPPVRTVNEKLYWGSSETVLAGQPMDKTKCAAIADKIMKAWPSMVPHGASVTVPAGQSHGWWPDIWEFRKFSADAAAKGEYKLTANFCGNTSITLGDKQEFMPGVEVINPGSDPVDLTQPIGIEWNPVSNARAYIATAFARKGEDLVFWTSSFEPGVSVEYMTRAVKPKELEDFVKRGIFISPKTPWAIIPKGIFEGTAGLQISVTAIGEDLIEPLVTDNSADSQAIEGIGTEVIVRSAASVSIKSTPGGK